MEVEMVVETEVEMEAGMTWVTPWEDHPVPPLPVAPEVLTGGTLQPLLPWAPLFWS